MCRSSSGIPNTALFSYNPNGDTLEVAYNDTNGEFPLSVKYSYDYKSNMPAIDSAQQGGGRAISPVLQKRQAQEAKRRKKEGDTVRLSVKHVEYHWTDHTVLREEHYDDSIRLSQRIITTSDNHGRKSVVRRRWNDKGQLVEITTTRYVGDKIIYEVSDRMAYDRNGDPFTRTRNGRSVTRPAVWKFTYKDYDDEKNWTRRTYSGPAEEHVETVITRDGAPMEKLTYSGQAQETDTRIIRYY